MASISDLFNNAVSSVETQVNNVVSTGAPALIAAAEQYGAQQLQGMAQGNITTAQNNVQAIINQGGTTSQFGAAFQSVIASISQGTFVKNYGTETLLVVGGILLVGFLLK